MTNQILYEHKIDVNSNIDTKKEAKKRLENLRDFSNSSMPIRVLLRNEEELKVYEEVMKSMRKISNLELRIGR